MIFPHRHDRYLHWREPSREGARVVLNYYRQKSFNRAHDSGVNHHNAFLFTTLIYTIQIKTLGHIYIELNSRYLPFSTYGIFCHKVEFGGIKSRFTYGLKI